VNYKSVIEQPRLATLQVKCVITIEAYGGVRQLSDFIKNIVICVLKMNEGLKGLDQHEGQ